MIALLNLQSIVMPKATRGKKGDLPGHAALYGIPDRPCDWLIRMPTSTGRRVNRWQSSRGKMICCVNNCSRQYLCHHHPQLNNHSPSHLCHHLPLLPFLQLFIHLHLSRVERRCRQHRRSYSRPNKRHQCSRHRRICSATSCNRCRLPRQW